MANAKRTISERAVIYSGWNYFYDCQYISHVRSQAKWGLGILCYNFIVRYQHENENDTNTPAHTCVPWLEVGCTRHTVEGPIKNVVYGICVVIR